MIWCCVALCAFMLFHCVDLREHRVNSVEGAKASVRSIKQAQITAPDAHERHQAATAMAAMLANPATNSSSFQRSRWGLASDDGSSSMSDT